MKAATGDMKRQRQYRGGYQFAGLSSLARVLRFPNERILNDPESVLEEIAEYLPADA
jgi:very-short-patch-repair endonuclease